MNTLDGERKRNRICLNSDSSRDPHSQLTIYEFAGSLFDNDQARIFGYDEVVFDGSQEKIRIKSRLFERQ